MPRLDGKIVYVIGAGASSEASAPILSEFMEKADELRVGQAKHLINRSAFDSSFDWINTLRKSGTALKFNNLEEVFSYASLCKEIGTFLPPGLYSDFFRLIVETLQRTIVLRKATKIELPQEAMKNGPQGVHSAAQQLGRHAICPAYDSFIKACRLYSSHRQELHDAKYVRDSFVTFNYDPLLELSLVQNGMSYYYGGIKKQTEGHCIAKPHGSINWLLHDECLHSAKNRTVQCVGPNEYFVGELSEKDELYPTFLARNDQEICELCNSKGVLKPVLLPPTWSKSPRSYGVEDVWTCTLNELESAEQIVIIGYSMPPSDYFFPYMLAHSLRNSMNLRRVVVVNPYAGDVIDKLRKVLPDRVPAIPESRGFGLWAEDNLKRATEYGLGSNLYVMQ